MLNVNDLTEDAAQEAIINIEALESVFERDPDAFLLQVAKMNAGNQSERDFQDWLVEEAKSTEYVARQVEIAKQNHAFYGD